MYCGMSDIANQLRNRTFQYSLGMIAFCRSLPNEWVAREIGRQLLRAGMGVSGNYWSACRGRSDREFIAKLGVAADEADESVPWLMSLLEGGIRQDAPARKLLGEGQEIRRFSRSRTRRPERIAAEGTAKRAGTELIHQLTKSPIRQLITAGSP